jgi:signal transduction histidine kinase
LSHRYLVQDRSTVRFRVPEGPLPLNEDVMSADTRTSDPNAGIGPARLSTVIRTTWMIAALRICVLAVVMVIFLGSAGIREEAGSAALAILVCAGVFASVSLVISTRGEGSSMPGRGVTLLIDVALVTAWVLATGGGDSEFWTLYLIVIVAVALRFGIVETVGVALGLAVVNAALLAQGGGMWTVRLYRPTLLLVAGFAVGVLSLQRVDQRKKCAEMEAIAESKARQLGRERAEVERLRRVDLARTEFVGVAAHELRTPLAAILGVLTTLKDHGAALDDDVRVELIEGAESQAERLSRLVEDLLTVTRIQDGVLRLTMTPVDAGDLIADAARASGTRERLRSQIVMSGPVVCDADAIVRVLTNLFDNAGKYSPADSPIVVAVAADQHLARFEVRDAGSGIAEADHEAIFERFRRADESDAPGAGLGLYISRGLVRAHGGELEVGEASEGGASFSFWLPVVSPGEHELAIRRGAERAAPLAPLPPDVKAVTVSTVRPD